MSGNVNLTPSLDPARIAGSAVREPAPQPAPRAPGADPLVVSTARSETVGAMPGVKAQIAAGQGGTYLGAPRVRGVGAQGFWFNPDDLKQLMAPQQAYDVKSLARHYGRELGDLAEAYRAIKERDGEAHDGFTTVHSIGMALAAGATSIDAIVDYHAGIRDLISQAVKAYGDYQVAFTYPKVERLSESVAFEVARISKQLDVPVADIVAHAKAQRGTSTSYAPISYIELAEAHFVEQTALTMDPERALAMLGGRANAAIDPSDRYRFLNSMIVIAERWREQASDLDTHKARTAIVDDLRAQARYAAGTI